MGMRNKSAPGPFNRFGMMTAVQVTVNPAEVVDSTVCISSIVTFVFVR